MNWSSNVHSNNLSCEIKISIELWGCLFFVIILNVGMLNFGGCLITVKYSMSHYCSVSMIPILILTLKFLEIILDIGYYPISPI
jgi:hypothetical protein